MLNFSSFSSLFSRRRAWLLWLGRLLPLLLIVPECAWGLGFRVPNQDAEAIARGNAFTATADNPSAIYYNPAGITQLKGQHLQAGMHILSINSTYLSGENKFRSEPEVATVPQFYYVLSPEDSSFSFGLGAFAPFGLGIEWPEDVPFRELGLEGRLLFMTINPVVAWQVHPNIAIAAGPMFHYSEVKLRHGFGLAPGDQFRVKGDDIAFGFNAAFRWDITPKWAVGAHYRSGSEMVYRGVARVDAAPFLSAEVGTSAALRFPQFVSGGISFRPTRQWNLEVNVDWTDWDVVKVVQFRGTDQLFGQNAVLPLRWRSSFLYHAGMTRYLPSGYWIGAGYFFSENSVPDAHLIPLVPDTDLHVGTLGFGYKGEKWAFAASGQLIAGPTRTVEGSLPFNPLAQSSADGGYRWFNQAVNVSLSYRF